MFEAGMVVLIPFPYSDLSSVKKQPVLMLTQPDARGDFLAMPLTSQVQPSPAPKLNAGPLPLGGTLPLTSWVKTNTVYSLSEAEVLTTIGRVTDEFRTHCVQHLCRYLNKGQ